MCDYHTHAHVLKQYSKAFSDSSWFAGISEQIPPTIHYCTLHPKIKEIHFIELIPMLNANTPRCTLASVSGGALRTQENQDVLVTAKIAILH